MDTRAATPPPGTSTRREQRASADTGARNANLLSSVEVLMSTHPAPLGGIHHVTAIARDPARNVDFYARVLGLRLVKRTVNFDDPGTYHLYYGDEQGRPGTIVTFFPWPLSASGSRGLGQAVTTSLRVPAAALGWWRDRLREHGVLVEELPARFGD